MKWTIIVCVALGSVVGLAVRAALASNESPFQFEYSQRFSDVYVMRVRDTSEGVVCYVARSPGVAEEPQAGISCVRVVP